MKRKKIKFFALLLSASMALSIPMMARADDFENDFGNDLGSDAESGFEDDLGSDVGSGFEDDLGSDAGSGFEDDLGSDFGSDLGDGMDDENNDETDAWPGESDTSGEDGETSSPTDSQGEDDASAMPDEGSTDGSDEGDTETEAEEESPKMLDTPKLSKLSRQKNGVKITWKDVDGADKYRVLYKTGSSGKWKKLKDTTSTEYSWKKAESGKKYKFAVVCLSKDGSHASEISKAKSIQFLSAPTNISVRRSGDKIEISWKKVPGAKKYRVLTAKSGKWRKYADTVKTSYAFKPEKNTAYRFTVCCVSSDGKKHASEFNAEGKATLVPMKEMARYSYFKKYMNDSQYGETYKKACKMTEPLAGLSKKDQLTQLMYILRAYYEKEMTYSTKESHYNDPYGYFIKKCASCAGCTRATGFCLNLLGMNYEHVNENQWDHQWTRVKVGNEYWICDAYGLYAGKEPGVRKHPYV